MRTIKPEVLNGMVFSIIVALVVALISPVLSFAARDLSSVADGAVTQATTIARALSVLGVLCGAVFYQIPGATMFARGTIVGGLIGAGLSFAGPSLIGLFRGLFGG
ncbi:hypothetical protein WDW86_10155 [Bdellovibrionota bacterium FG-2]